MATDKARIAVAYFSGTGHTARLAHAISDGAGGAEVIDVATLDAAGWATLDAADCIVFGSPTFMGSTAAQFDAFLEDAGDRWLDQGWANKMAAGFTVASHPSGDKFAALMRMVVYAAQMGMVWVGQAEIGAPARPDHVGLNRDGAWLGLVATAEPGTPGGISPGDHDTALRFGQRVRLSTERWRRGL